jgi:hypothetical protein
MFVKILNAHFQEEVDYLLHLLIKHTIINKILMITGCKHVFLSGKSLKMQM